MPYVPTGPTATASTDPLPSRATAMGRAVRGLHADAERRLRTASPLYRAPARSVDDDTAEILAGRLAQMHTATTRYVGELRAEGARPEQMLVRVKACVRAAMAAEGWRDPEALQVLTAEVVRWSIDAYYDR